MGKSVSLLVVCMSVVLNELTLIKAFSSEWPISFDGCGSTKGCYRFPRNCRNSSDCHHALTWQNTGSNNENVSFEYAAAFEAHLTALPPWAGFGLADKPQMPGASVVDCIAGRSSNVSVQMSYNVEDGHRNHPLKNKYLGLVLDSLEGAIIGSHIFCNFTRQRVINDSDPEIGKVKNLTSPYYVLFATGQTDPSGGKAIHDFNNFVPHVSSMKINFDEYLDLGDVCSSKDPYIRAHATLMIVAWVVVASLGMFTSRYMKNQWNENGTICGKPHWFQIHRYLMGLVLVLTLVGILVIFAYNNWKFIGPDVKSRPTTIHPTLGVTTGALMFLNLVLGIVRPNIYSAYRIYFWFFHAFFGHISHLLAAVTMFFGVMQNEACMPDWTKWVVVGFACWRLLADAVMTITRIHYNEQPVNYVAMANNEVDEPATKVAALRCAVMIVYLIGVVLLALTLIIAANVPL